jgi:hypothetical protein
MAFTEDLDIFFNEDDFAVSVTLNGDTFSAILDTPTDGYEYGDASVEADHKVIRCKTADLVAANIARRDTITVDGDSYKVANYRHEGQGTSIVWLETV